MKTFIFTGRVIPERCDVNLSPVTLDSGEILEGNDLGLSVPKVTISICRSFISAKTDNVGDEWDVYVLKNTVEDLVSAAVDATGYKCGCSYDVSIDQVIDSEGNQEVFSVQALENRYYDETLVSMEHLIRLSYANTYLRAALADLRRAGKYPTDTAFHIFRAMEDIRTYFVDKFELSTTNSAPSWKKMGKELNLDKSLTVSITPHATTVRHGRYGSISTEQRQSLLHSGWQVVTRYIMYLNDGEVQLDRQKYPIITSE